MSRFWAELSAVDVRCLVQVSERDGKSECNRRDTKQKQTFLWHFVCMFSIKTEVKSLSGLIICSFVRSIDSNIQNPLFVCQHKTSVINKPPSLDFYLLLFHCVRLQYYDHEFQSVDSVDSVFLTRQHIHPSTLCLITIPTKQNQSEIISRIKTNWWLSKREQYIE